MAQQKTQERTSVPYIVHESSLARMERQLKRVWIFGCGNVYAGAQRAAGISDNAGGRKL